MMSQALQHLALLKGFRPDAYLNKFAVETTVLVDLCPMLSSGDPDPRSPCRYCRIVAADVLARLATELDIAAVIVQQDCLLHLVSLLRLPHKPGVGYILSDPSNDGLC